MEMGRVGENWEECWVGEGWRGERAGGVRGMEG